MDTENLNKELLKSIAASINETQHMNYGNAMRLLMQAELLAEGIKCDTDLVETIYQ